jgi:hypothetical protein
MNNISVIKSLKISKDIFKKNWIILVYATIFPVLFALFIDQFYHVGTIDKTNYSIYYLGPIALFYVVKFLIDTMFKIGKFRINLQLVDGKSAKYSELFNPKRDYLTFLVVSILLGLCTLGGFIFFIIPGIYVILTYCFAPILVLDKGLGISDAFTRAKEMAVGNRLKMLIYYVIYGILVFFFLIGAGLVYSSIKTPSLLFASSSSVTIFVIILIVLACVIAALAISNLAIFHLYKRLLNESVMEVQEGDEGGQLDFHDISKDSDK